MVKTKNGKTRFKGTTNLEFAQDITAILCTYLEYETEGMETWTQAGDNLACILYSATNGIMGQRETCALTRAIAKANDWIVNGLPEGE